MQGCLKQGKAKEILIYLGIPFLSQAGSAPPPPTNLHQTLTRRGASASRCEHEHCSFRSGQGRPWEEKAIAVGFSSKEACAAAWQGALQRASGGLPATDHAGCAPSRATKESEGAESPPHFTLLQSQALKGEECGVKREHGLSETI